jgi:2-polyprenyl-6-methoxyphenol hydroxylase-like FAD-dependent oxidoreductase
LNGRTAATADGFDVPATARSRIGAGVVVSGQPAYHPGSIFMATGCGGYVGLVVLEDSRLDIAAAFDPGFVRDAGGLGEAAARTLAEAGFPAIPALAAADWKGTPALTRTADRIAGERWFAVGDACGYVEPFTGEGMAWAVGGAAAVARLTADGWNPTLPAKWETLHHRLIGRRQRFCRLLAPALRSRLVRRMMVSALRVLPVLASPFVRGLNRPPALAPEPAR